MFMKSMQMHDGTVFAVGKEGKWLFTGGWDKTVNVQVHVLQCFHPLKYLRVRGILIKILHSFINTTVYMQELSGDEFQVDARPIGSIPCDSIITALLCSQGKLFVGYANKLIKVCINFVLPVCP